MNALTTSIAVAALAGSASAQAFVDFDGGDVGLISYHNTALEGGGLSTDGKLSANEKFHRYTSTSSVAFNPMSRAAFSPESANGSDRSFLSGVFSDDTVVWAGTVAEPLLISPPRRNDSVGFAGVDFADNGFFGIRETRRDGSGAVSATFVLDISGLTDLYIAADFIAAGSFQFFDLFEFTYSIDGGADQTLFTTEVAEDVRHDWIMDDGDIHSGTNPLLVNGVQLSDEFQNIGVNVPGSGSELSITIWAFTTTVNGLGIDNISVTSSTQIPAPGTAVLAGLAGLGAMRRRRA